MDNSNPRSFILKLIVLKKALFSLVLLTISLTASWSWRNYESLTIWADNYLVDAEYTLVQSLVNFVVNSDVSSLRTIARLSGIYGLLLAIATVGLWYQKHWAHILFTILVGMLLPVEVFELIHELAPPTVLLFTINLAVFIYLFKDFVFPNKPLESSTDG
ncbi:MAG: DUF2127 domain-containing protein [Cyanobacteria bacterium J06592_8]